MASTTFLANSNTRIYARALASNRCDKCSPNRTIAMNWREPTPTCPVGFFYCQNSSSCPNRYASKFSFHSRNAKRAKLQADIESERKRKETLSTIPEEGIKKTCNDRCPLCKRGLLAYYKMKNFFYCLNHFCGNSYDAIIMRLAKEGRDQQQCKEGSDCCSQKTMRKRVRTESIYQDDDQPGAQVMPALEYVK